MPMPVEALPCGSRSTSSTCLPQAARAVARLIAVVVLPTPPFWLAMARTRALRLKFAATAMGSTVLDMGEAEHGSLGVGAAGNSLDFHLPAFRRGGQFDIDPLPLEEQAN